ncbi:LemA family protein [Bosea caraganae]|uniref:LemA family protein n=1 Tax=Bosea caraganae TaxID=2763117 RepID=UPI0015F11AE1|nr:LemA family protein [Bosea caraganae]
MTWVLLVILLGGAVGLYIWYAAIVTRRNKVDETLGGIDAQLQQRHDLIPNVLAIARRFMEHEKTLLEEITALRTKVAPQVGERDFAKIGEKFQAEAKLGADLTRLFAVAENYPDLTSSGPMIEAQRSYNEVEANIAAARRFYNSAVGDLRNAVQIFPGGLLAGVAGVSTLPPFYETTEAARAPVNAVDHL